jgi:CheY-like chemotaxis protein
MPQPIVSSDASRVERARNPPCGDADPPRARGAAANPSTPPEMTFTTASAVSVQATQAPAARKKILLVDDSATTHMWIRMILNKSAYEMVSARDGVEGVALAAAETPDLILMDVVMPRMGGFEAVREIRARPASRSVPIIMVTTRAEAKNVEEGFASGCSDYVTKPIDSLELLSKIRNFLEG